MLANFCICPYFIAEDTEIQKQYTKGHSPHSPMMMTRLSILQATIRSISVTNTKLLAVLV